MTDKSAQIVSEAIARNISAVLSLPSAGMFRNHKSRFICEIEGGILLQAPPDDQPLIKELLRTRSPCIVSFRHGINKVIFAAPIRKVTGGWKLNDQITVDGLLLEFPTDVKVTQKRSDYRVEIPPDCEISVQVWRMGASEAIADTPRTGSEVTAEIYDLSTGGVGVKFSGNNGEKPKICTEDRLRVGLTFNGSMLLIEGRMRPPAVTPQGNTIVTGIRFKPMEDNLEGRKMRAQLLRIVGELQRQELRSTKLGLKKTA